MDLDDLKTAWRALDQRVEAGIALNLAVLKELEVDRARSALGRLAWLVRVELASGLVWALVVGAFVAGHIREPRFAVAALVLLAVLVLTIANAVRHMAMISRIDYSAPVVTIQRSFAELRASRLRATQRLLLFAPLLWTPLAIVGARSVFGLDIYRIGGIGWVAANLTFGVAAIPVMIWIAQHYADRFDRSPFLKRLADDVAGRSLSVAMGLLDEVARFEED